MLTGTIWLEEMEHSLEQNVVLPWILPWKMEDKGENLLQTFPIPGDPGDPKMISLQPPQHPKDQGAYFMLPPGRVSTSVNWILALNLSKLISGTFVREMFKCYPQKSSRHLKLIDADLLS